MRRGGWSLKLDMGEWRVVEVEMESEGQGGKDGGTDDHTDVIVHGGENAEESEVSGNENEDRGWTCRRCKCGR